MLNKVMLIGRLGADPEIRYMPSGDPIATIRLATSRRYKNKQTGERLEETEWHRVVFFAGLAKIVGEYLKKGSQIYVDGRIRTNKWQGQDGQDRYTTEIIAETMNMLDTKRDGYSPPASSYDGMQNQGRDTSGGSRPRNDSPPTSAYGDAAGGMPDFYDDIPFASLNSLIKNHLV